MKKVKLKYVGVYSPDFKGIKHFNLEMKENELLPFIEAFKTVNDCDCSYHFIYLN